MSNMGFQIATYSLAHYAYSGDFAARLDLFSRAFLEGNGPSAMVEFNRDPSQPETVAIVEADEAADEPARANVFIHFSRLSEWIDTLRNEKPVWFEGRVGTGVTTTYASLTARNEPVGENEPQP